MNKEQLAEYTKLWVVEKKASVKRRAFLISVLIKDFKKRHPRSKDLDEVIKEIISRQKKDVEYIRRNGGM